MSVHLHAWLLTIRKTMLSIASQLSIVPIDDAGNTPVGSSSIEDSSSEHVSQAGKSNVARVVKALPTQHVIVLCG